MTVVTVLSVPLIRYSSKTGDNEPRFRSWAWPQRHWVTRQTSSHPGSAGWEHDACGCVNALNTWLEPLLYLPLYLTPDKPLSTLITSPPSPLHVTMRSSTRNLEADRPQTSCPFLCLLPTFLWPDPAAPIRWEHDFYLERVWARVEQDLYLTSLWTRKRRG